MAIAKGIKKISVLKKQSAKGTAASGSGGQTVRRVDSKSSLKTATYTNDEINSHQQSMGDTHGLRSVDLQISGLLSPGTYIDFLASILRKNTAATTAITGKAITIGAAVNGIYPLTVAAATLLTTGYKVGDVIRLSVGTLHADNINKNLLITAIASETACSVKVLNGSTLTPEGPISGCTVSLPGKKTIAPLTGHTADFYTLEDWYSDIAQSELFTDVVIGSAAISLPPTGNATIQITGPGLNRTLGTSQVLTTPTAETATNPMAAINGLLLVNGSTSSLLTGLTINIDGQAANVGAVVGSNVSPDIYTGDIMVSGSFNAFFTDQTLTALYDAATQVQLIFILTDDTTATSNFIGFNIPAITLHGDDKDDGKKAITATYPFSARILATGGAALANDKTIISIQDSAAA